MSSLQSAMKLLGLVIISLFSGMVGALVIIASLQGLDSYKDSLDALQSIVTIAGIVAAGYWWLRRRSSHFRSDVTLAVTHRKLPECVWLRVSATIRNKGDVLLQLQSAHIMVQQVLPVPDDIANALKANQEVLPESETETEALWNLLRESKRLPKNCEIEPGETDTLNWDFFIPTVETLLVYAHFANAQKSGRGPIGWTHSTVYDLATPHNQQILS